MSSDLRQDMALLKITIDGHIAAYRQFVAEHGDELPVFTRLFNSTLTSDPAKVAGLFAAAISRLAEM